MIKKLEFIKDNTLCFVCYNWENNHSFHRTLFSVPSFDLDILEENKKLFLNKVNKKNKQLKGIKTNDTLLLQEINYSLSKHLLLEKTFDVEANKINNNWNYGELPDYEFLSKSIYKISSKDIKIIDYPYNSNLNYNIFFSLKTLKKLLIKAENLLPELKVKIGEFSNFAVSYSEGIKIPQKNTYNIQEIITLFFHEMTHYVRFLNMEKNLDFAYQFSDSNELEEGLALYNEYFYGNQIIDYGTYYPYYHKVYNVLMSKGTKQEKLQKMYEILKHKGFSKDKVYKYFLRFYRFAPLGGEKFIFKEAIYYNSYKNVEKLLKDGVKLDYLMSMKGGINTINYFFSNKKPKNINYKEYFETMVKEIRKLIN